MDTLHLPGVKTAGVQHLGHGYLARAEIVSAPTSCPKCSATKLSAFGTRKIRYMDLPLHGERMLIDLTRQRYQCQACKATFVASCDDFDAEYRLTARAVKWMEKESIRKPFTHVAEHVGVDEKVVRKVFRRYAQQREKELIPTAGKVLGIDELYLLNKHRCIITNLGQQTIVDLLEERKYPTVVSYLKQLNGVENVERVCIDMWQPYKAAVSAAIPKAHLIVDKFHVVKLANWCMDIIRKSYQSTLATGQRRDLMHGRHILLTRRETLNDDQLDRLQRWRKACPELADSYDFKERFFDVYSARSAADARKAYDAWVNKLPLSISKAFKPLMTAVNNWEAEIFSYFDSPITNAYTECLNGIAKITNRTGRGYSFDVIRFKLLFGHSHQKRVQPTMRSALINLGVPFSTFDERFDVEV